MRLTGTKIMPVAMAFSMASWAIWPRNLAHHIINSHSPCSNFSKAASPTGEPSVVRWVVQRLLLPSSMDEKNATPWFQISSAGMKKLPCLSIIPAKVLKLLKVIYPIVFPNLYSATSPFPNGVTKIRKRPRAKSAKNAAVA